MTEKGIALRKLQGAIINGERLSRHEYIETAFGKTCYCAVGFLMKECEVNMSRLTDDEFLNTRAIGYTYLEDEVKAMQEKGFTLEELEILQAYNDEQRYDELLNYVNKLLAVN